MYICCANKKTGLISEVYKTSLQFPCIRLSPSPTPDLHYKLTICSRKCIMTIRNLNTCFSHVDVCTYLFKLGLIKKPKRVNTMTMMYFLYITYFCK